VFIHSIDFIKYRNENPISSIIGKSSLQFNDFQSRNLNIHTNEYLILNNLRNFQLVEINILNDFQVRGTGHAGDIYIGSELSLKNSMPNYIEWLAENEKVKLLIAILFPILSIIIAMLYRLKIIDEN